jgi:hypothetical protein
MSESKKFKEIKNRFYTLVQDETEMGIVTALHWYTSLNLKKISIMINKPESTTLRYIRKLKDQGIIVFDSEKSEDSWGKFYKLSTHTKTIYDEYMYAMDVQIETYREQFKEFKNLSEKKLTDHVIKELLKPEKLASIPASQSYFSFVSNLQNVMINETINQVDEVAKLVEKKGLEEIVKKIKVSPMDISVYVSDIKISKWKHVFMMNELIFSFLTQIDILKKEIEEEMNKEKIPEDQRSTQFLNIFTGNLDISYKIED